MFIYLVKKVFQIITKYPILIKKLRCKYTNSINNHLPFYYLILYMSNNMDYVYYVLIIHFNSVIIAKNHPCINLLEGKSESKKHK
jgi:hypothetical protein